MGQARAVTLAPGARNARLAFIPSRSVGMWKKTMWNGAEDSNRGDVTGAIEDGRRQRGRPSRQQAVRLDAEILRVALRSFLDFGFDSTTIEQIAAEVGTTRRTVSHRYPTKEALFLASATLFVNGHAVAPIGQEGPSDPLESLRFACRHMLMQATSAETVAFYRMCVTETERIAPVSRLILNWDERNLAILEKLVLNAQRAGLYQGFGAATIATLATGVMGSNPLNRALLGDLAFTNMSDVEAYFNRMWPTVSALA